jgi:3-methylfumaryl-CoA hydratase
MSGVSESAIADWQGYVGKTETRCQLLDAASLCRFAVATGAEPDVERARPPLASWAWFHDVVPDGGLGVDGHPRRGGFLPPVPLPRRMFAATAFRFEAPLLLDWEAELETRIAGITHKSGRSGDLVFVEIERIMRQCNSVRVAERQTIVYREAEQGQPLPFPIPDQDSENAPAGGELWHPGSVHLFRFSAVTFNSHRIHYDRVYATEAEGYPALLVHGPFTAAKLAALAARDGALAGIEFRFEAPLYVDQPVRLAKVGPGDFQALRCDGVVASRAKASYR